MKFSTLDELRAHIRKICREKRFKVRMLGNKIRIISGNNELECKDVTRYYRNITNLQFSFSEKFDSELMDISLLFWEEKVNILNQTLKDKIDYIEAYHSNLPMSEYGFIVFNGRCLKEVGHNHFDMLFQLDSVLSPFKEEDPFFQYKFQTGRNVIKDFDSVHIYFDKTGVSKAFAVFMQPDGTYKLKYENEEVEILELKESSAIFSNWLERIYKQNRLNALYSPPKTFFNRAMITLRIYHNGTKDMIYSRLLESLSPEDIELESLKMSFEKSIKTEVKIRSFYLRIYDFDSFYLVYDDQKPLITSDKKEATEYFEKRMIERLYKPKEWKQYKAFKG